MQTGIKRKGDDISGGDMEISQIEILVENWINEVKGSLDLEDFSPGQEA